MKAYKLLAGSLMTALLALGCVATTVVTTGCNLGDVVASSMEQYPGVQFEFTSSYTGAKMASVQVQIMDPLNSGWSDQTGSTQKMLIHNGQTRVPAIIYYTSANGVELQLDRSAQSPFTISSEYKLHIIKVRLDDRPR